MVVALPPTPRHQGIPPRYNCWRMFTHPVGVSQPLETASTSLLSGYIGCPKERSSTFTLQGQEKNSDPTLVMVC